MFSPTSTDLFLSKNDPEDQRLGDLLLDTVGDSQHIILGYPDDEGIKNNGGRIGATQGPDHLREQLFRMTPPLDQDSTLKMYDHGNLELKSNLADRHDFAKNSVLDFLKRNKRVISLGGGHDYAYPDGWAAIQYLNARPLVVNFDAHFDVRPVTEKISSGTPFYRLLEEFPNQFEFVEIGIQHQCNSKNHYQYLLERGCKILFLEDVFTMEKAVEQLDEVCGKLNSQQMFLSVDLDVFSSAYAPGCSQSWPTGMTPDIYFAMVDYLLKNYECKNLGIYENCPRLDVDFRTSRLGALIAYHFIYSTI